MSERREPGGAPPGKPHDEREEAAAGRSIGREAEPERPAGSQPERASQSGDLPPDQPDEGWQDWPGGHREGRPADDDLQRRKG